MAKYLSIKPKLLSKVAVLLHRQNPKILSIESASQLVETYVKQVQKEGRKSKDGTFEISTAGFGVRYFKDEDGFEEVNVYLNVLDLWYDEGDTQPYVWGAIDRLKTSPASS